eukprot:scaffold4921_cov17-Prasinocladus_malaysianus.AAC.1
MSPSPAQRPTAAEVLKSDVLPPLVGDEQLKVNGLIEAFGCDKQMTAVSAALGPPKDLLRSLPDNPIAHDRT